MKGNSEMSTHLCIYHGNCLDGFGAAWAIWKKFPDMEFYSAAYNGPVPDVTGKHVVMVDFSYKRPVINDMAVKAKSVLILDHHKSAAEDLQGFPPPPPRYPDPDYQGWLPDEGVFVEFDMDRSGAIMAWDHFHGQPTPKLMDYIQDRDLWRFELPDTKAVHMALTSFPYDFNIWDELMLRTLPEQLAFEGKTLRRKFDKDRAEAIQATQRWALIAGHVVPVVNVPYNMGSDSCHDLLAKFPDVPFAAYYVDNAHCRTFGTRSEDNRADVAKIAEEFGGGGHRNASGFRLDYHDLASVPMGSRADMEKRKGPVLDAPPAPVETGSS